ncbi:MAG TPA: sigma-70 family RNA polymerase sigma factor [Candidatus Polarisedimenticolia bacterium]|jgi:RNA polymerase sigma-70 factor (ECF subfamily)|nr:sigma-70 family RNA polymerase sigma factor [Candidatus Polarisedimenticolia bacterium]
MDRPTVSDLQRHMERLADGDRASFHPVFAVLWPFLRRFAARHLGPEEAEDAAQEALVKVFFRASEFDASRSALAWALGITAFEIRTARRRRQRRREESSPAGILEAARDAAPTPEAEAMIRDLEATLGDALGALRPEDAETLRLYARGDRPALAAATFRKRVERALARLRAVWRTTDGRP